MHFAMEFDADIHIGPVLLTESLEEFDTAVHILLAFDVLDRATLERSELGLHGVHASFRIGPAVHADPIPRRAAEQLVDRHTVHLALDVP